MYITYILIGITTIISFYAFKNPVVMKKLMMNPHRVDKQKEYYRLITSGFIHADHTHLLVNMFSFYFFGTGVERVFHALFGSSGSIYFVAMYIAAIIVSDLPSFFKHRSNTNYNSLGASGGIAAVVFAYIIFQPLQYICIFIAVCMPGFILGTLYIVFSYLQGRKPNERLKGINHDAHLYGALFGLLFCIVIYPDCIPLFFEQVRNWEVFQ